jgi:hypothetical protein
MQYTKNDYTDFKMIAPIFKWDFAGWENDYTDFWMVIGH